jgi:hypothetical protein
VAAFPGALPQVVHEARLIRLRRRQCSHACAARTTRSCERARGQSRYPKPPRRTAPQRRSGGASRRRRTRRARRWRAETREAGARSGGAAATGVLFRPSRVVNRGSAAASGAAQRSGARTRRTALLARRGRRGRSARAQQAAHVRCSCAVTTGGRTEELG